jgi:hypothetical protein
MGLSSDSERVRIAHSQVPQLLAKHTLTV